MSRKHDNQKKPTPAESAELLGYHLGIADDETRARVEAAFPDAASLSDARARVERILSPLESEVAPPLPADLARRIVERAGSHQSGLRLHPVAMTETDDAPLRRPLFTLSELAGLAAAIALFIGIFLPGYRIAREGAARQACMSNMRQIGMAYVSYEQDHGGYLPFVGTAPAGTVWLSVPPASGRQVYSNSQQSFVLIRRGYVRPEDFICAGRPGDVALQGDSFEHLHNFPEPRNNSYSPNFAQSPLRRSSIVPDLPVLSDMTPLADPGGLVSGRVRQENSISHGGRGQNILRVDMSIIFSRTPRAGVAGDDIFRILNVEEYTGVERPRSPTDAFMMP